MNSWEIVKEKMVHHMVDEAYILKYFPRILGNKLNDVNWGVDPNSILYMIVITVLSGRPLRLRVLVPATNYVCKILLTS